LQARGIIRPRLERRKGPACGAAKVTGLTIRPNDGTVGRPAFAPEERFFPCSECSVSCVPGLRAGLRVLADSASKSGVRSMK
jgi:hypothetical protein